MKSIWLGEVIFVPGGIMASLRSRQYWKGNLSGLARNTQGIIPPFNRRTAASIPSAAIFADSGALLIPLLVLAGWAGHNFLGVTLALFVLILAASVAVFGILSMVIYLTNRPRWLVPPPLRD
jgi:hypothetical protein